MSLEMSAIVAADTKPKKLFDGAKHTEGVIYFPQDDSVVFSDAIVLANGKQVTNSRVFAEIEPGQPDGFIVDRQRNILTSSADSVRVYDFEGNLLGKIFVSEVVANLTLGGKNGKILFIAAGTSLYEIELK